MKIDPKVITNPDMKIKTRSPCWRHVVKLEGVVYALDFYNYRRYGGYYCNVRMTYQHGWKKNLAFKTDGSHMHLPKDRVVAKFWVQRCGTVRKIVQYLEKTYEGEPRKDWSKGWGKFAYYLSQEYLTTGKELVA